MNWNQCHIFEYLLGRFDDEDLPQEAVVADTMLDHHRDDLCGSGFEHVIDGAQRSPSALYVMLEFFLDCVATVLIQASIKLVAN
jgi:hypothetical protein